MKSIWKIIIIIIIVLGLSFVGYSGYLAYHKWQQSQKSQDQLLIESLKANKGMIVEISTELAEIKKKVNSDTLKETIVIKEEAPTYESKKEELIELRKDPIINEEQIKVARIEFEDRINEFQASPDKILINMGDEKIILYEDINGNLVSLESGVTITRHRKVEDVINDLKAGQKVETIKKKDLGLKAGGYYDIGNKGYGLIVSKDIINIKDYSLNVSLLSDLKDLEGINLGANINYNISNSLELGAGITIDKDYYIALEYSF